jgi:hypothetical protein
LADEPTPVSRGEIVVRLSTTVLFFDHRKTEGK